MSYRDTSPSPVKMDREYRLSQPVNCLRNHLISWEPDRKKNCGFVRNHFIWPGTSASPNILNYLAFGAQFNPDAATHARACTHTHFQAWGIPSWLNPQASRLCPHFLGLVEDVWLMPHMQLKLFEDNFSSHSCLTSSFIYGIWRYWEKWFSEIKSLCVL